MFWKTKFSSEHNFTNTWAFRINSGTGNIRIARAVDSARFQSCSVEFGGGLEGDFFLRRGTFFSPDDKIVYRPSFRGSGARPFKRVRGPTTAEYEPPAHQSWSQPKGQRHLNLAHFQATACQPPNITIFSNLTNNSGIQIIRWIQQTLFACTRSKCWCLRGKTLIDISVLGTHYWEVLPCRWKHLYRLPQALEDHRAP